MAASQIHRLAAAALLLTALSAHAAEAPPPEEQAFAWSADVVSSDFRSERLELSGNVRITQGDTSIESTTATAEDLRSDRSTWTFKDSVQIRTPQAELTSDSARASFNEGRIARAQIEGSPAQFAQRGPAPDGQVHGRAGAIDYNFVSGVVRLTDDVWFSNGKDEFSGDVVVYDVRRQRVQINPAGESNGRVRGVIRTRPGAEEGAGSSAPTPEEGNGA